MKIKIALTVILLTAAPGPAELRSPVSASLAAREKEIVVGQPPVVILALAATAPTIIDLGGNKIGNLEFTFTDPSGRVTTARLETPEFAIVGKIPIEAGRQYRQVINIASIMPSRRVGRYSVGVKVLDAANPSVVLASAVPVTINVEPGSKTKLRAICDGLKLQIEKTSSDERSEFASELSSIHDPVAVGDIRALLGRGLGIDDELIVALEKIGDSGAIDALKDSLANADPDTVRVAQSALAYIQRTAESEALRTRAREALSSSVSR
jgi:hypothetical protein